MANWKIYTIRWINYHEKYWRFYLDSEVSYSNTECDDISVIKSYPFTLYRAGDKIEIDNDRTRYYINAAGVYLDEIEANNMVRKFSSSAVVPSSSGSLTIPTTPSSAAEVARTVTQTVLDHADRTGGTPQIEIGTDKTSIWYHPPKK